MRTERENEMCKEMKDRVDSMAKECVDWAGLTRSQERAVPVDEMVGQR